VTIKSALSRKAARAAKIEIAALRALAPFNLTTALQLRSSHSHKSNPIRVGAKFHTLYGRAAATNFMFIIPVIKPIFPLFRNPTNAPSSLAAGQLRLSG
jgi:hypothetical protein